MKQKFVKHGEDSKVTEMALVPMLANNDSTGSGVPFLERTCGSGRKIGGHLTESFSPVGLLLSWRRSASPQPKSPRNELGGGGGTKWEREKVAARVGGG